MFIVAPLMAKNSNGTQDQSKPVSTVLVPSRKVVATPIDNQVKNQNEVQTKNQGEDQQLNVKTQENEQLNQTVEESLVKVSDQVQNLIDTVGAKGGIGQQVKEIAQNQTKLQNEIKLDIDKLNSRGTLTKLIVGSDKQLIKTMQQKMNQNQLMIQQLEQLKLKTNNTADLQQLQSTVDLMTYQNTSLQNKIDKENESNGLFGWLLIFFNK